MIEEILLSEFYKMDQTEVAMVYSGFKMLWS